MSLTGFKLTNLFRAPAQPEGPGAADASPAAGAQAQPQQSDMHTRSRQLLFIASGRTLWLWNRGRCDRPRPTHKSLQVLWIAHCGLQAFDGIGSLPVLRELYASYNEVERLEPLIGTSNWRTCAVAPMLGAAHMIGSRLD